MSATLYMIVGWLGMIQGHNFWSCGDRSLAVLMMIPSVILCIYGTTLLIASLAQVST